MVQNKIIYFSFLLVFLSTFSFGDIKNLTLNDAIKILKENNPQLQIANLETMIKEYDISIASASSYGKMDVTVDTLSSDSPLNSFAFKLQNKDIKQADFDPNKLNNPSASTHYDLKVSYTLPIFTGGLLSNYKNIASSMYQISKLDKKDVLNKKIFETKKTFYNISLLNKYIENLDIVSQNMKKLKKTISAMGKEGYAKKTDVLEINAKISTIKSIYKQGISFRDNAYHFLSFLLNDNVVSIVPIDSLVEYDSKDNNNDDAKNTINVLKAKQAVQIQDYMQNIQIASFLPKVGFFADMDMENDEFSDFENSYTLGIRVKMNMFNGGSDFMKYQQSKIEYFKAKENLALAKKAFTLKAIKIISMIDYHKNEIQSLENRLKLSKRIYKIYKEKYKEGLSSINDVLIKQSEKMEVLSKLLKARSDFNSYVLELNYVENKK